jgi:hypothetical protein
MTQLRRQSPWYWLATLVILLACSHAMAIEIIDVRKQHQQASPGQPVTGFYAVTPDGKTKPIDPVKSGLATSGTSDLSTVDSEPPNRSASTEELPELEPATKKTSKDKPRKVRIRIKRKPPERNLADQFQCERHGFYYTNDGRCILPSYGHLPVIPHLLPTPGVPPMMAD